MKKSTLLFQSRTRKKYEKLHQKSI